MASKPDVIAIPIPRDPVSLEPITEADLAEVWERLVRPTIEMAAKAQRKNSKVMRTLMGILTAVEPALKVDVETEN